MIEKHKNFPPEKRKFFPKHKFSHINTKVIGKFFYAIYYYSPWFLIHSGISECEEREGERNVVCIRVLQRVNPEDKECYSIGVMKGDLTVYFGNDDNRGYTRGGIDVTEAINLFLKFLLLSPVILLAGIVTATMLKHVIYQGVPTMSKPTESQQEQLRVQNSNIGIGSESGNSVRDVVVPVPEVVVKPVVKPVPVEPRVLPVAPPTRDHVEEDRLRKFCIDTWLPKYGNNPNAIAAGGPCFDYQ